MTKKDSGTEKDTDRARYYSQFWLDVAAGKQTIGSGAATTASKLPIGEEEDSDEEFEGIEKLEEPQLITPLASAVLKNEPGIEVEAATSASTDLTDEAEVVEAVTPVSVKPAKTSPSKTAPTILRPVPEDTGPAVVLDVSGESNPQEEEPEPELVPGFIGYDEVEDEDEWGGSKATSRKAKKQKKRDPKLRGLPDY